MKREIFLQLAKNRYVQSVSLAVLLLQLLHWGFIFYKQGTNADIIPLHYNIYYGIDWLGSGYWLYLYPFLGLLIYFLNMILAAVWYARERWVSYFLVTAGLLANLLLATGLALVLIFYYS